MLPVARYCAGGSAVRYPRDSVSPLAEERFGPAPPFEMGRARPLVVHDRQTSNIIDSQQFITLMLILQFVRDFDFIATLDAAESLWGCA